MTKKVLSSLCCVALLASASVVARADTFTFDAVGTATGNDGPVDAQAVIVTSAGQIQVTLTNLLSASSIVDVGQAIADISFTVSNTPGTEKTTTTTAVGQQGTVNSSGKVTYTTGDPGRFIGVGGGSYTASNTTDKITLEAIGSGQPDELILPSLTNGGTYTSLNNGATSHNPYTIGPAVFTLDFASSGITANTTISDVTISFGTSPDTFLTAVPAGSPAITPEPSSLILLGTGVVGLAGAMRRRMSASKLA